MPVPVEVVLLIVSLEPLVLFFFFDFLVLFIVLVSVWLLVEVFWAKTAMPESSERPRVAIMIFFITGISPYLQLSGSTMCCHRL